MISSSIKHNTHERGLFSILCLVGLAGGIIAFPPSYFAHTIVLVGSCLFPFAFHVTGAKRHNWIYVLFVSFFALIATFYNVRFFYFLSLAFYFLWLTELFVGKLNPLILFLVLFMSPAFIHVVRILGFPIRLLLSQYAGQLLNISGLNVRVEGNLMIVDGSTFSVDEACMGLNMLAFSMLIGIFILAFHYRNTKSTLGLYATTFFFATAFVLNILTNIIRILILVIFQIIPENPMHEMVGVLCLIVYVAIPLHFVGTWMIKKYGKAEIVSQGALRLNQSKITLIAILSAGILLAGISMGKNKHMSIIPFANVQYNNHHVERLDNGISKLYTEELLIYIKVIPEFFSGEHSPLICWKGSGYEFSGISSTEIAGVKVYKGTLVKDGQKLHTAWWYSNGKVQTISQLDWRLRMLKGEDKFCIVNVTAEEEATLMNSIRTMLVKNTLAIKVD